LVEKQGAVATRQEIIDRLWGKEVFVDTEHGINTAIRKIRQVLDDDPNEPRFVQTVTGKGYRFVAAKTRPDADASDVDSQPAPTLPPAPRVSAMQANVAASAGPSDTLGAAENTAKTRPKSGVIAALTLCLAAAALFFLFRDRIFASNRASQIHSLAVLPLLNLSGDASQDYFADGMTDELITALAQNRSLRVVSRTSAMQYKGVERPLPQIARELGVDGILEGSIERSSRRVHMTVQLIYAPTDTHIWAESYDRDLSEVYSLPEELSQTVAREVKAATSPLPAPRYINPEAHDAYLHGRYFWFTFNVANTLPYFQKAIQLQPDYAAAWSGLADTYALEAMETQPATEVADKTCSAAAKSLELDPSLPETHNSMAACYLFFHWDPVRAEAESRRALELGPNDAEIHHLLSYILLVEHRYAEGEVEAKRTAELDPFIHPWELGNFYRSERKFDDAMNEFKMQVAAHPRDPDMAFNLSGVYWLKGMYKESQAELERALELEGDLKRKIAVHRAWVDGGEPAAERWGAENTKAEARKHYVEIEFVASIVAYTGNKNETMKYLEASYRERDPDLIFIQDEPMFDFLHSDPRYQALVKKMGLPLYQ
ncbi:MAG TPA: winged helix-turn-helix domain-containing protein, partial [Verrucomicrobiae bacterium]|nr:winged helix-turn-helix domain-containing protein [Verrucomicrobiae bacterium]